MKDEIAAPPEPARPPELEPAWQLILDGNFSAARRALETVLATATGDLARAARHMRGGLDSDPWARRLAAGTLAILVYLAYIYI
jgi:hypothetical protein